MLALSFWALLIGCRPEGPVRDACGDGVEHTYFVDADRDSYGGSALTAQACEPRAGLSDNALDCDDFDADVHPGAAETCNGIDDDCDGVRREARDWYEDSDDDGFGNPYSSAVECDAPAGFVGLADDCDDHDPAVNPDAIESCTNDIDDDCDGFTALALDADGDGYVSVACAGGDDCDDTDASVNAGAVDACEDGVDGDCDGKEAVCNFEGEYDLKAPDVATPDTPGSNAGAALASGDATGDGIDDILVGAPFAEGGIAYLLSGAVHGEVSLDVTAFRLSNGSVSCQVGGTADVEDINGDGIGDLAIGANCVGSPKQIIVLGPVTGTVDVSTEYDAALTSVLVGGTTGMDVGDVTGDGIPDSVVAAGANGEDDGTVYVRYGPITGDVALDEAADAALSSGVGGSGWGRALNVGPDIDGDGVGDMVIGSPLHGVTADGAVYVAYGPPSSVTDDSPVLLGSGGAYAGWMVSSGDYDGDGYADIAASSSLPTSQVAIQHGPMPDHAIALTDADVVLDSGDTWDWFGWGMATGDLERDGVDELLIGAPHAAPGGAASGAAYLIVDPPAGSWNIVDAALATFQGNALDEEVGTSLATGDIDGNGFAEIILGGPGIAGLGGFYVMYAD